MKEWRREGVRGVEVKEWKGVGVRGEGVEG